jgi:hypothetical protein
MVNRFLSAWGGGGGGGYKTGSGLHVMHSCRGKERGMARKDLYDPNGCLRKLAAAGYVSTSRSNKMPMPNKQTPAPDPHTCIWENTQKFWERHPRRPNYLQGARQPSVWWNKRSGHFTDGSGTLVGGGVRDDDMLRGEWSWLVVVVVVVVEEEEEEEEEEGEKGCRKLILRLVMDL